jgi:glycosyltransferase involved in cell wall biosynthesis
MALSKAPLVSIVLVCYNQEQFIKKAIYSVLSQTYKNIQLVIADDASNDLTSSVIRGAVKNHPEKIIEVIFQKKNLGITKNCNAALRRCKGELIAFIGGDDLFHPEKISQQVNWFSKNQDAVMCGHNIDIIDTHGNLIKSRFGRTGKFKNGVGAKKIIRYGIPFASISIMIKRNRIPSYGFHPFILSVSDWKMWIDVVGINGRYGFIDMSLAKYRRHPNNVTARINWNILRDIFLTCTLSIWHFNGRFTADWIYFFIGKCKKRLIKS